MEHKGQSLLLCHGEALRDSQIIGLHTQQPCHQRPVRTVAPAGLRKGTVQSNVRLHRRFSQKGPGHPPDAHSSRRVGTGGTYHNWSKDLKNIQHERSSFVTFL